MRTDAKFVTMLILYLSSKQRTSKSGRIQYGKGASLSGWMLVNGQPRNDSNFKRISAYVMQDDILYAFLTVKETIWLSAQLHLPGTISYDDKMR